MKPITRVPGYRWSEAERISWLETENARLTAEVERLERELEARVGVVCNMSANSEPSAHNGMLTDGFGNWFRDTCPDCGAEMQVVRPGDIRCSEECYVKKEADE